MKQTILFSIALLALSCSVTVGAELADTDGIPATPTTAVPETTSDAVVELSKRAEFARLFVATVLAGKDAAFETFTVENMKWLVACAKVYAVLMRNLTAHFITWFSTMMNNLRAGNAFPAI